MARISKAGKGPRPPGKGSDVANAKGGRISSLDGDLRAMISQTVRRTVQREVGNAVRDTISTVRNSGWMGPQQPVAPVGVPPDEPDVRLWDYTPGYNVNWQPRKYEPYSFAQLLFVVQHFDLFSQVLYRRINEVVSGAWELVPPKGEDVDEREEEAVRRFLEYPDRVHSFSTWLRMQLFQHYAIDAATVYVRRTLNGQVYSFDIVDGQTIVPLITEDGSRPEFPDPAYLQVVRGTPYSLLVAGDGSVQAKDENGKPVEVNSFTAHELLYLPHNPRPHSPLYGFCYSNDTEYLTRRGWRLFGQLEDSDEFATREVSTGEFAWQSASAFHAEKYSDDLVHILGDEIDLLVTPNHRVLIEDARDESVVPADYVSVLPDECAIPRRLVWHGAYGELDMDGNLCELRHGPQRWSQVRRRPYVGHVNCVTVPAGFIYVRRNGKACWCGNSQTEQAIMHIAIGIKAEQRRIYYETAGNLPEALIGVPDDWTAKQTANFQKYFDMMFGGNTSKRAGSAVFVPGGMKEIALKDFSFSLEMWEWLARVICAAFNVSSQPYVRMMNRSTAESAHLQQVQEGLQPDQQFVLEMINLMLTLLGTRLRFRWSEQQEYDPDKIAAADKSDISVGVKTIAEVRQARGLQPYDAGLGERPIFVTQAGPMLLEDVEGQSKAGVLEAQKKAEVADQPKVPFGQQAQNGNSTHANGASANGRAPQSEQDKAKAREALQRGGAQKLVKVDGRKYLDTGQWLVPLDVL